MKKFTFIVFGLLLAIFCFCQWFILSHFDAKWGAEGEKEKVSDEYEITYPGIIAHPLSFLSPFFHREEDDTRQMWAETGSQVRKERK